MNLSTPTSIVPFMVPDGMDLFKPEGLIAFAQHLIDGNSLGVLATMDATGKPHVRWMGTFSLEDFPQLYALTSPHSAKVLHIRQNPDVNWMFSSSDLNIVLNLSGRAALVENVPDIKRIWKMIEDKSQAFFLDAFIKKPGFAVIETTISQIECSMPRENRRIVLEIHSKDPTPASHVKTSGRSYSVGEIRTATLHSPAS